MAYAFSHFIALFLCRRSWDRKGLCKKIWWPFHLGWCGILLHSTCLSCRSDVSHCINIKMHWGWEEKCTVHWWWEKKCSQLQVSFHVFHYNAWVYLLYRIYTYFSPILFWVTWSHSVVTCISTHSSCCCSWTFCTLQLHGMFVCLLPEKNW